MKNNVRNILIVVVVILVGLAIWNVNTNSDEGVTNENVEVVDALVVSEDGASVSHPGVAGEIALDTLKGQIEVRSEVSDFGEFVTGIGDVDAEENVNFWAFYVNGEQAQVGAGTYETMEGDQIEWRLEEIIY